MMPELGNLLLCLALGTACLLSSLPLYGSWRGQRLLIAAAPVLAMMLFACLAGAFLILTQAFINNDFTVAYVAANSNTQLPVIYRMAATWGAHEGSMLLWVLIMSGWTLATALSRAIPLSLRAQVLAVMGIISLGFLLFIIFTSNPFVRTLPDFPVEGRDLNPMLQDPGLIFHPPALYMGYVGFSVAFAFAISALLNGCMDRDFARLVRPWTLMAWIFLTLGIVIGSLWAYYELGWGGWWFWDPVENASLMPWLAGTALLHSLAVTGERDTFRVWSVLLAIAAFSLCLLGTFLVRSGVLVSVHAFASDPTRGMFILIFMALVVGGSLLLFALRGHHIRSRVNNALWSRESLLLGNNVLLMTAMLVVLLGTLLPLVHKALGLGAISIGEPFFNSMFVVLMVPIALLMGLAPLVRWGRDRPGKHQRFIVAALIVTPVLALLLPWLLQDKIAALTVLGLSMALWIMLLHLTEILLRLRRREPVTRRFCGMIIAHLGVAVTLTGIAFHQNHNIERDVRIGVGDSIHLRQYLFTFREMRKSLGPNYQALTAVIDVHTPGSKTATLFAEKRYYNASRAIMTEAAIQVGVTRDLYAALGEQFPDGTWGMRLYYKPFIRWIWAGGILMALGGGMCFRSRRIPAVNVQKETA
ncbi:MULTISPECIES: heme lyase CcmF/NrfE family subunit [unclassified Leclercia]|uniref:Heme lyase CcmF/NrfE family subunit n=1 Tax=Leclercia barmai TaxID=2785629 RepID=A0ABS7RZ18_9ENTR|nr:MULTISPECIES: heme lyase CcmF/NrfE family subunit [unclassified Leclercia]MBZ0059547.1 heme lyase CcmF/NrfE family subunit [Leclercia sp. EMC7]MCM5697319.1 heme lyase CcmF/NrfE family subunit [Leclercia sp. LTM01]MCM5702083.1 heme lyase CcmF/NrfE family subunit [Leclercia sp. LTM14]